MVPSPFWMEEASILLQTSEEYDWQGPMATPDHDSGSGRYEDA